MKYLTLLLFAFSFIFCSCKEVDNSLLYGKWKGDQLIQDGKDLGAKLVEFNFNEKGIYTYQNSYVKEAGSYKTVEDKLYTTDTLNTARIEKVVRIAHLTTDSMYIQMNAGGNRQLLKCVKAN